MLHYADVMWYCHTKRAENPWGANISNVQLYYLRWRIWFRWRGQHDRYWSNDLVCQLRKVSDMLLLLLSFSFVAIGCVLTTWWSYASDLDLPVKPNLCLCVLTPLSYCSSTTDKAQLCHQTSLIGFCQRATTWPLLGQCEPTSELDAIYISCASLSISL